MLSNSTTNKRIAKNTLFLYIRMAIVLIVSLYTTRVVLRVLGVVDYGIYNVVCGFVSMFSFFNASLNTSANRFYNFALGKDEEGGVRRVYNAALMIQIIIVLIILLLIETVGVWYINNKMVIPVERLSVANWIFQYAVFSLVLTVLETPYSAALLAHEKMDYYALVSIVDVILKLLFVILLQYVPYDKLLFYGVLMMVVSVVNFLMYFIYCRNHFSEIRVHFPVDKELFKDMFSFSTWSLLDPITLMIQGQGCNMVLNFYFGPIINAAFGIANQISGAINGFTQNISDAFRPQIIQSFAASEYSRTKNLMYSMSKINYMLHLLLIVPVILNLKYLLELWLGNNFPDHTIPFATFVMIIATINCLHAPISTVMVATGKIKKIKTFSLITMSLVIPISILLFVLGFQANAIFIVLLILTIINILISAIIMCQTFSAILFGEYVREVIFPCALFSTLVVLFPMCVYLFMQPSFVRLLIIGFLALVNAVGVGYWLVLNRAEKDMVLSMIKAVRDRRMRK